MWWQYIVTFIGSLAVALSSVWFAQWLSAKREYRKALEYLKNEVSTNIKVSGLICQWVDRNLEASKDKQMVVASCPHLYDSAWVSVKGALAVKDYVIAANLEEAYFLITVVNDHMRNFEELRWGVGSALKDMGLRMDSILKVTRLTIVSHLMPKLEEAISRLDKKLKVTSTIEGQTPKPS